MGGVTSNILAMWTPGPLEMVIILGIVVLLFGRRLPEIARNMGRSLIEFKKGMKELEDTKDDVKKDFKEAIKLDDEHSHTEQS
jgi:sec-independent protein translocase protein TatA